MVDLASLALHLIRYQPASTNHSSDLLIHKAANITKLKVHVLLASGISITQITGSELQVPHDLEHLVELSGEDKGRGFHTGIHRRLRNADYSPWLMRPQ